jgi:hypothetical protein
MKKIFILILSLFCYRATLSAQCTHPVTNTSGIYVVNGITVAINSYGDRDSNNYLCPSARPYLIGFTQGNPNSGSGGYFFSFTPSISSAMLNFSAISNLNSNTEVVRIFVNNVHYPVSALGSTNGCDPMALITPQGDLGACNGCQVVGTNGIVVNGPISLLTVEDSVISGAPGGASFSLFICDSVTAGIADVKKKMFSVFPNPVSHLLHINSGANLLASTYSLYDFTGKSVLSGKIISENTLLELGDLPEGVYLLIIGSDSRQSCMLIKD